MEELINATRKGNITFLIGRWDEVAVDTLTYSSCSTSISS